MQTKSFAALVTEQATAIQGASSAPVDLSIGSILRAVVEAYSALAMWLQGMVLTLLATTRASTSTGADLDSWMADYGLVERLPATAAAGTATFSRFTTTTAAAVPVGTVVQTADASQQYAVSRDTTNVWYRADPDGYVMPVGTASVDAPIAALVAGSAANVPAGGIATIAVAVPGVDTITNAAAITSGADVESDVALRTRFVAALGSLAKATPTAIKVAAVSIASGTTCTLIEGQDYSGGAHPGYFYLVVDDGSGTPPSGLLAQVYAAVDRVRPVGSTFGVFAPLIVTVNVVADISVAIGFDPSTIYALVQAAITDYIDSVPNGTTLSWSRLIQVIYDASDAVTGIPSLTVNGGQSDIVITAKQTAKAGTVTVS